MKTILQRISDNGKETLGVFIAIKDNGDVFTMKTLELPWKYNQTDISCIPAGIYPCKMRLSPRFKRDLYEIQSVPKRNSILWHPANYVRQLNGCVAGGLNFNDIDKDGLIDVENSKKAIDAFHTFMGKLPFTVEVRGI